MIIMKKESNTTLFIKRIRENLINEIINYTMKEITIKISDENLIKELKAKINSVSELTELFKQYFAIGLKKDKSELKNRVNSNIYGIVKDSKGIAITKIENCIKINLFLSKDEEKILENSGFIKEGNLNPKKIRKFLTGIENIDKNENIEK